MILASLFLLRPAPPFSPLLGGLYFITIFSSNHISRFYPVNLRSSRSPHPNQVLIHPTIICFCRQFSYGPFQAQLAFPLPFPTISYLPFLDRNSFGFRAFLGLDLYFRAPLFGCSGRYPFLRCFFSSLLAFQFIRSFSPILDGDLHFQVGF